MTKKNAFYAQSGGVTAVINASGCGVIETCRKHSDKIGNVLAGKNGIIGALTEDLIDTAQESDAAIATRIRDILHELDGYEDVTVTVKSTRPPGSSTLFGVAVFTTVSTTGRALIVTVAVSPPLTAAPSSSVPVTVTASVTVSPGLPLTW